MRPVTAGAIAGVATGGVVAAASRGATLVPWPARVRTAFPFALGIVSGKVVALEVGLTVSALRAARGRGRLPVRSVLGLAALTGAAAVAGRVVAPRFLGTLAANGRGLDPGFATEPASAEVSGSAASLVPLVTLGREGARYVGSASTADDVREVTGADPVATPVRVFVGVDSAPTVQERVDLAMAELHRTGAFDRTHLLIQAPAGSGYANPTPVDVLEVLTRGDSAAVSVGYGLLPSFLSLDKVGVAAQTQKLLLDEIRSALAGRTTKPRLLLYGESLGARVQQAAIPLGSADLDAYGIAGALWVGTPGGKIADLFHQLCAAESITVDRPEQIPRPRPVKRVWFLEHDGDPVVRFRPELIAHRPAWLPTDGTRGRNIPTTMRWKPGITFAQAFVDTLFATNVKPGDFQSLGHDYRADLGGVAAAAFGLDPDAQTAARLETYLRRAEVERAARIGQK